MGKVNELQQRVIDEARKRRERALELREAGKTVQQVGDILGVTKQRAAELIARARRDRAQEPA